MGFLNFLKPKKGQKADEMPTDQLPPLSGGPELYSELPTLPEAPEMPNLPEIEFPQPLRGFEEPEKAEARERPQPYQTSTETVPLMPDWPKMGQQETEKMPELPKFTQKDIVEDSPAKWLNIPPEVPQLKPFNPKPDYNESPISRLVAQNNSFFLRAEDFRMVQESFDKMLKVQKKHHSLTEIKKEENAQYERINALTEEVQRKLTHIDRTLFE